MGVKDNLDSGTLEDQDHDWDQEEEEDQGENQNETMHTGGWLIAYLKGLYALIKDT